MTRADFLSAVHELADKLGAELWRVIERQTGAARATAMEVATAQLHAQIAGDDGVANGAPRKRAPRRCSGCEQLGHDVRKCPASAPSAVVDAEDTSDDATP